MKRNVTPFDKALAGFDAAMKVAERRRHLKTKFGLTDPQIGLAVLARRKKSGPYGEVAKAVIAAKSRMKNGA